MSSSIVGYLSSNETVSLATRNRRESTSHSSRPAREAAYSMAVCMEPISSTMPLLIASVPIQMEPFLTSSMEMVSFPLRPSSTAPAKPARTLVRLNGKSSGLKPVILCGPVSRVVSLGTIQPGPVPITPTFPTMLEGRAKM